MKKLCVILIAMFSYATVTATNYFVDGINGNNANTGLMAMQAFRTIVTAANLTNPGDTVFIMNGIYASFTINRAGSSAAQIVYTNYPGHFPQLVSTSSTYNVITVAAGANYVTVNGLEIIGYGVNLSLAADTAAAQAAIVCPPGATSTTNVTFIPKYNGSGINIGNSATVITHHVTISNNKIHDCAAVGIGVGYSDYIQLEGNTVYNNSWYTPYGTSGISFGNSANYDNNTTTYRNIVRNNLCYGNRLYVLWRGSCTISDGNGIILDIPRTEYNGRTLVANNICYNNGGSGIHSLEMDHVDFFNNVAYLNSASPESGGSEIYAYNADDVRFYNNILVSRPGKSVNRSPNSTNIIFDYNIYYGGSTLDFVGAHSLIQEPGFVNPSTNPATADFRLREGGFAVNNGDNTRIEPLDRNGNNRPIASVVDIGAYESSFAGNLNNCSGTLQTKILGTGNGTGEGSASILFSPLDSRPGISNQKSRKAINYPASLFSDIPSNTKINSIRFRRAIQVSPANTTASNQKVTDNSILKIYLRNETSDNFGPSAFDWTSILPGAANAAVLVYGGEAASIIGDAGGWINIPFQIPFTYTGGNLGVFVEYLQKGSLASATDINWIYDNGGSQPVYNITNFPQMVNAYKYVSTNGAISNTLSNTNERRPVMSVGYCTITALPVTLLKFGGTAKGGKTYLNWLVNEVNNAGFQLERSKDGYLFEPVAFVVSKAATGNNLTTNHYNYTDLQPFAGTCFYRLLQKDKDGRETYSYTVSINHFSTQAELISVYPNPVGNQLNALINVSGPAQTARVSIRSLTSGTVRSFEKKLPAGYTNVAVDVSKLSRSAYLLIIELSSGERLVNKFFKE